MNLLFEHLILLFSTVLGVLPLHFLKGSRSESKASIEGFCAGAMLGALWLGLLQPALELQNLSLITMVFILIALALGYLSLEWAHQALPHEHEEKGRAGRASGLRRSWLLTLAILLHNIPEGLSVGISQQSSDLVFATISLQDLLEGLIVAFAPRGPQESPFFAPWVL